MRHKRIGYRARLRLRRFVFERDGFRCRKCGKPGRLEAHHVRPVAAGGNDSPENILTLCVCCHIQHHRADDPARAAWRAFLKSVTP